MESTIYLPKTHSIRMIFDFKKKYWDNTDIFRIRNLRHFMLNKESIEFRNVWIILMRVVSRVL